MGVRQERDLNILLDVIDSIPFLHIARKYEIDRDEVRKTFSSMVVLIFGASELPNPFDSRRQRKQWCIRKVKEYVLAQEKTVGTDGYPDLSSVREKIIRMSDGIVSSTTSGRKEEKS